MHVLEHRKYRTKTQVCKRFIFSNLEWFGVGTARKLGKVMGFDGISLPNFPKLRRDTSHRMTQNASARVRRARSPSVRNSVFRALSVKFWIFITEKLRYA